jgi:ATP-dependent protease ClpP protease subunit
MNSDNPNTSIIKAGVLAVFALCLLAFAGGKASSSAGFSLASRSSGLSVQQEPSRIVLKWSGEVEHPMRDRLAEAFEKFEDDSRQLVLVLNSPGGSVQHGREVMQLIHKVSIERAIDTHVDAGAICASMCVPIYLVGAERTANPRAKFMFHEVRLMLRADTAPAVREALSHPGVHKMAVNHFTNQLFGDDIGPRSVDAKWLEQMRKQIKGRDVWLTGKQLMEQGSGVVDKLL